jgi:hypothetical protein
MLDTLRDFAVLVAALAGAIIAVASVAKIPVINRPIRWLFHTLIADPLSKAHHRSLDDWAETGLRPAIHRIEHEIQTNDGSSLRDVADRVEESTRRIEGRLDAGEERFAAIEAHIGLRPR